MDKDTIVYYRAIELLGFPISGPLKMDLKKRREVHPLPYSPEESVGINFTEIGGAEFKIVERVMRRGNRFSYNMVITKFPRNGACSVLHPIFKLMGKSRFIRLSESRVSQLLHHKFIAII